MIPLASCAGIKTHEVIEPSVPTNLLACRQVDVPADVTLQSQYSIFSLELFEAYRDCKEKLAAIAEVVKK